VNRGLNFIEKVSGKKKPLLLRKKNISIFIWVSDLRDFELQAITQMKMKTDKRDFQPSIALYTSIGYTIVSLLVTLIFDRSAFIILKNVLTTRL
jgi:hypothetical protein